MSTILPLAQAAAGAPSGQGGMGAMLVPMVIIFAIFYFLMVRPQQRKEKERQKTIESLRAGTRVLFAGGLIGTISEVKQNTFVIELEKGSVEVARGAIIRALKDDETPAAAE